MNREINTISYLPLFIQEHKEIKEIAKNNDIELSKLYNEIKRIKENQYILTADQNGLRRFEKLVNINDIDADLETRRKKVLARWQDEIPYTYKWLDAKLLKLLGMGRYEIILSANDYQIEIVINCPKSQEVQEVIYTLENYIPANLLKIVTKYNNFENNIYTANILKLTKYNYINRQITVPNIDSTIYQAVVISSVKDTVIDYSKNYKNL